MRTALVEREGLGGVCLNWGCIPSKALLRNAEVANLFKHADEWGVTVTGLSLDYGKAMDRSRTVVDRLTRGVAGLLQKNKVTHVKGEAVLTGNDTLTVRGANQQLAAKHIILATGARALSLPGLPVDGKRVLTSREAIVLKDLPKSAAIIGGGAIGCEFASIWSAYGVQVTIVELLPRLLPTGDAEVSQVLERGFARKNIAVMTGAKVTGASVGEGVKLSLETPQGARELAVDLVLVAVGIQGNVENIGLDAAGVKTERGFITVNGQLQTSAANVYAIGDVTGKLPLAHVASTQGVSVVERLAGKETPALDYVMMPRAVYSQPQAASFGLTEEEAKQSGRDVKIGKFPMIANGKALALGERDGFVKLIVDAKYGEIIGAHMVGPDVTELLAEVSLTQMLEGTTRELGWLTHAHPSLSEAIKEAALGAFGEAIHI
jgi:dihydrolipoamide dehydrogenase